MSSTSIVELFSLFVKEIMKVCENRMKTVHFEDKAGFEKYCGSSEGEMNYAGVGRKKPPPPTLPDGNRQGYTTTLIDLQ